MRLIFSTMVLWIIAFSPAALSAANPLPSWNNVLAKQATIAFVERVAKENSPNFVRPAEHIAVCDNDGLPYKDLLIESR